MEGLAAFLLLLFIYSTDAIRAPRVLTVNCTHPLGLSQSLLRKTSDSFTDSAPILDRIFVRYNITSDVHLAVRTVPSLLSTLPLYVDSINVCQGTQQDML